MLENLNNQSIYNILFIHFFYTEILQILCSTYNKLNEELYAFKIQFK
jgi:hypothetical protein